MIRPQLNHLGIYVYDLPGMEKFYTEVIGLIPTDRGISPRASNKELVFMSASPTSHHQLVLIAGREADKTTVQQISFLLPALADLRELAVRVSSTGSTYKPIDHGIAWSIYTSDPEGNGIDLKLMAHVSLITWENVILYGEYVLDKTKIRL